MNIHLIAVGRMQKGPERQLMDEYARRLQWPFKLTEIDIKKPARDTQTRKTQEAEKLLAAIPHGAYVIALDERGKQLASRELAQKIGRWSDEGARDIALIIGGADGLDQSIRDRAHLTLGLGALTWPHMLVRAMIVEQIYRSWSILSGHPYHRD